MQFRQLTEYFGKIESTSLRNEKTVILAEILREAKVEEVDKLVYLALGSLRPAFDRLEFNMAEKMILRALGATNEEYQKVGDLGELVVKIKQDLRFKIYDLSVEDVYGELEKIARDSGNGSQDRKVMRLAKLIRESDPQSAKYIVRMVAGKLRLGFSDKTVVDALSYLETGTKEFSDRLENAYQIRPDVGVIAQMVKEKGIVATTDEMKIVMGTPIVPALAQRLKTAQEMIEKMGRVYVEKKWDGTRVQIHFSRKMLDLGSKINDLSREQGGLFGEEEVKPQFWVRSFTRNLDESSDQFPELGQIGEQILADEVILDSEAVGYDPKTGANVPFQLTITRKRKHGVVEAQKDVPLRFNVFDIMYLNGQSLIHLPLKERREILEKTIKAGVVLAVDPYLETEDPGELREYHREQLKAGYEGALVKQVDGTYMPGRTGFNWVKFKEAEDSRAKLSDTIDVVIMGYYLGKGKRSEFTLGAFLVGILDSRREERGESRIVTVAKVGTGITDLVFGELGERLKSIKILNPKLQTLNKATILNCNDQTMVVPETLTPDVWVEPKVVVEVAADEITVSPTHTAGYALRFPRLVKFRDDKNVENITTLDEIVAMGSI